MDISTLDGSVKHGVYLILTDMVRLYWFYGSVPAETLPGSNPAGKASSEGPQ